MKYCGSCLGNKDEESLGECLGKLLEIPFLIRFPTIHGYITRIAHIKISRGPPKAGLKRTVGAGDCNSV